ncbi:RNA-binding protein 4 [Trypanosoma rangeli]|uniref:RNA-binding protein 4 n=1 Tax=Trypanosoma rangeli TaxID=5698 RepID=A0A422NAU7_TRYRA|nr:RNA-binding protein 4 [Trypanosoma rangeli]RNF02581.1 RNA-binding protein 4 [Trypanosoma rangeli]|eukprot:RNF02581.1 RNA-binding protein 4 [Trypanosoma rangeli]
MNANPFYTQLQPEYTCYGSQQPSAGSGFLLPTGQITAAGSGPTSFLPYLCVPSGMQLPQDQKKQMPEGSMASSGCTLGSTPAEAKDGELTTTPFSGALHDMSNSIWAMQEPVSSKAVSLPSLSSGSSLNYSFLGTNCMISTYNAPVATPETSNQTYLYPVSMKTEENGQTFMLFPSRNKEVPDPVSPAYYFLVNSPQSLGPLQYTTSTMQPTQPNPMVFGANASAVPKNSRNAPQQPSPFQMPTGQQPPPVSNNFGMPWPPHYTSNMAAMTAGVYPRRIENPKVPHKDTSAFTAHGQQRANYTNTACPPSLNLMPSPNLGGNRRQSSGCSHSGNATVQSKDSRESGNSVNATATSGGSGSQELERQGGLPYDEDPTPIDITKTQLIVNFLPQLLTDEGFRELFTPFGEIHTKPTKIIYDRGARRGKGYGFVYYKDGRSTEAAIKTVNGLSLGGRRLKVRYADQQRRKIDCDSCEGDEKDEENEELHEELERQEKDLDSRSGVQ